MTKKYDKTAYITGLNLFSGDESQLLNQIRAHLSATKNGTKTRSKLLTIATPNPEMVVLAAQDAHFAQLLQEFSVRIPDGAGLVAAAKLLGELPANSGRITGVSIVTEILSQNLVASGKALVLGGRGYANLHCLQWSIQDASRGVAPKSDEDEGKKTLWWHYGFLERADQSTEEQRNIRQTIEAVKPTVLFVALGAPVQEQWLLQNQDWLEAAGVRVAMVVGGAFDMLLGKIPRAPGWMQRSGLEWLYRLYQEPWRWRRQLSLVRFIYSSGKEILRQRYLKKR